MLNWSNRVTKSITFTQEEIDQDLLAQIEVELDRHPHKTFSDLCKEALWQLLNTSTSMLDAKPELPVTTPVTTPATTQSVAPIAPARISSELEQIAQLRRQFYDLEQRLLSHESSRFEAIEQQIQYLAQKLERLEAQPVSHFDLPPSPEPIPEAIESEDDDADQPVEADPLLSRLSQYIDDF
jgi:hypothetical protein